MKWEQCHFGFVLRAFFVLFFVSRDVRAEDLQLADVPTTDITVVRTRDPVRLDAPACEPIYAVWSFRDGEGEWGGSNAFSRSSSGSCLKKKKKRTARKPKSLRRKHLLLPAGSREATCEKELP